MITIADNENPVMAAFEKAAKGLEREAKALSRAADTLGDERIGDAMLIRTNAGAIQGLSGTMDRMAAVFENTDGPTPAA